MHEDTTAFRFDRNVLAGFLALDLIFIAIHLAFGVAIVRGWVVVWPDFLNINRDWGASEILGYAKWLLIVYVFIAAFVRRRSELYLGLAILFTTAVLDDSLQIHERGAPWLVARWDLYRYFGKSQSMAGEVIVWAALGVVAVGVLAVGWFASGRAERRRVIPVLVLFGGVVFFAIGMDIVHSMVDSRSLAAGILGVLEDGGEMVFITLLLALVWRQFRTEAVADLALFAKPPVC